MNRALVAAIVINGLTMIVWLACAPQGTPKREAEDKAVVVLEKAACILIESEDPNAGPVCAKAAELTPLVPIILGMRTKRDAGAPDAKGD